MAFKAILLCIVASAALNLANPLPDSAGIVEMTNGLAYGGIPYGSVSGMVAKYMKPDARGTPNYVASNAHQARQLVFHHNAKSSAGVAPVQIFSHPGVVAPGVVGMIHQIGY